MNEGLFVKQLYYRRVVNGNVKNELWLRASDTNLQRATHVYSVFSRSEMTDLFGCKIHFILQM